MTELKRGNECRLSDIELYVIIIPFPRVDRVSDMSPDPVTCNEAIIIAATHNLRNILGKISKRA